MYLPNRYEYNRSADTKIVQDRKIQQQNPFYQIGRIFKFVKQGYNLFYYDSEIEMNFFIRDADSLIAVELKANDGATESLKKLLREDKYPD
jgi:hypothetical protein